MKVWMVQFPDDKMLVDGSVNKRTATEAVMASLSEFVNQNIELTDYVPADAPKASFGNQADVSQQVEETG